MWDFESANRRNLSPNEPWEADPLHFGALVHRVLEEQVKIGSRPDAAAVIADEERKQEELYSEIVGARWSDIERESSNAMQVAVKGITDSYFDFWGDVHPLGEEYRYLVAEITFRVPIPETKNHFRGTIDGIVKHLPTGQIWIIDHKTYGQKPAAMDKLKTDPQFTSYAWAAKQLLGFPVEGVIYDGIAKQIPEPPNILQNGTPTKAWSMLGRTTAIMYHSTLKELGLDIEEYRDILQRLWDRDQSSENNFFTRYFLRYSDASIESQGEDLQVISREMAKPDVALYPQFLWQGCHDCDFRDLCSAVQHKEDTSFLIENRYRPGRGWKTTRTENPVTDLRHLLSMTF